jgi:Topoisomerase 6 subunit A/Spo11, Toprim domain
MTATNLAEAILGAVRTGTKAWTSTRKAEERDRSRAWRRYERLTRPAHESIKTVAWAIMERAYLKASNNGTLYASARQIMYAARPEILERCPGRTLDGQYFSQTLLPDYIEAHPAAQRWRVAYDARGSLAEPHTDEEVPLGTTDVDDYLQRIREHRVTDPEISFGKTTYPTVGPRARYGAIVFIEKEGFMPLFEDARFKERYDLALMTTKGMSVTACRRLVDAVCGGAKIPLLVFHDFDKSGFSILATLRGNTRRYRFMRRVQVIDCGLRLADVRTHGLQSEGVGYASDLRPNLRQNGATAEEIAFLCPGRGLSGQRVELNAFTSDALVAWMEAKFAQHGVTKVVPDEETLKAAYSRAVRITRLEARLRQAEEELEETGQASAPKHLAQSVRARLAETPARAWDAVVAELAAEQEDDDEEGNGGAGNE